MDITSDNHKYAWCKSAWSYPSVTEDMTKLLKQCALPGPIISEELEDVIKRSKSFPISFPINTVRLEKLKERRPEKRLKRNIESTYPVIHERVLYLMAQFILHKREYGSAIERKFYKDTTVAQLVDRILKKRAVTFLYASDDYLLLNGERGSDGWESVGTPDEQPPLVLEDCLSYDEMKLSAMVFVSGYTECINDGARNNSGVVNEVDIEEEAVIIGVIGTRFERNGRMDYEDVLISKSQNTRENGYGGGNDKSAISRWRKMWAEFYQVPSVTYDEVAPLVKDVTSTENNKSIEQKNSMDVYVKVSPEVIFDNVVYYKRLSILAETVLLEAEARGNGAGREVYLNIIGAGLGVWKVSQHQKDVYVLAFLDRARSLLLRGRLHHLTDVNFAYIRPSSHVTGIMTWAVYLQTQTGQLPLFENSSDTGKNTARAKRKFLPSEEHPKGGVNVQIEIREPTSKLQGEHAGKLLVTTYAWDGNAHPGNEFWLGSLSGSGDPAAACSTQVSELHNAHINTRVRGDNVHVAGRAGITSLRDCCFSATSRE